MKKILIYFLAFVVLIQLYRPKKNKQDDTILQSTTQELIIPDDVKILLQRSCYDCHSNNTNYTWYHEIAPFSWGVAFHIYEGKKHLNFDKIATYNPFKLEHAIAEIHDVVKFNEMPLKGYILFHPETKLSPEEVEKIVSWTQSVKNK